MHMTYPFDRQVLVSIIDQLQGRKVLLVGDTMLDEYLKGDAWRISPEAPIPIVTVIQSRQLLGGAGNVARNIVALGGCPHLISVCGTDTNGETLQGILDEQGIVSSMIHLQNRPTTLKTRVIARNQQMLRIDHEDASPLSPDATHKILNAISAVLDDFDVLIISDYGKGVVTRELMQGVIALRDASTRKPRILVDPKTPNYPLYKDTYILTPNAKETSEAAGIPVDSQEEILKAGRIIMANLHSRHLLTTLGSKGMALFVSPDEVWHIPTVARTVFDVTGAGDTVMGTLALCLAANVNLLDACILANYAAGLVIADVGASTVAPSVLKSHLATAPTPQISRW